MFWTMSSVAEFSASFSLSEAFSLTSWYSSIISAPVRNHRNTSTPPVTISATIMASGQIIVRAAIIRCTFLTVKAMPMATASPAPTMFIMMRL